MDRALARRSSLCCVLVALATPAFAQSPRPLGPNEPLPRGQRIDVKDGDTIVVRGDARVRIVHRSEAVVRALYNAGQRWLVLLVDYADPQKGAPDGSVDATYRFDGVDGVWPLGERWEGSAVLDDYSIVLGAGGGLGISTDGALVQLFQPANARWFADARATVLSFRGSGRTNSPAMPGAGHRSFAEAEEYAVAEASRNAENRANNAPTTTSFGPDGPTASSALSVAVGAPGARGGQAPVRVGGNIASPIKVRDVKPTLPDAAAKAGVRGVVILEIVIGADGAVSDARILRSIPLLDDAAVAAVRQWRYTPTLLNGQPVPVVMTVTVAFQ